MCGVAAIARRVQNAAVIFCYHNVVPVESRAAGEPGLHVRADDFERQVRWLTKRYTILPLSELVSRISTGRTLRRLGAITFDDGYYGVFDQAVPILRANGVPATIFVVGNAVGSAQAFWWDLPQVVSAATPGRRTQWVTGLRGDGAVITRDVGAAEVVLPRPYRAADAHTIRDGAGAGIEIGAHSMTHRSLPLLSDDELDYDVAGSRTFVGHLTGTTPGFFAYPYGHWDARVRDRVRQAGYQGAVTLDPGLTRRNADAAALRRVSVPATISIAAFDAWSAGLCL